MSTLAVPFYRADLASAVLAACLLAAPALAQQAATPPPFTLEIRAPAGVRPMLERHLELQRYREVSDLDDAELARLMVLAERDARELLATMGFFSPRITLSRQQPAAGGPPAVILEVDPGQAATVAAVELAFAGDIATSTDPGAAIQRTEITRSWQLPRGQRFTQDGWDAAKADALRRLVARRYPGGSIGFSLADIDAPAGQARLGLRLDSGPLVRLGSLQVTGMQRYDPLLVPRLARLPPGMVYDQDRIQQAQLRLAGSGYFDSAFITVDPAGDPLAAPVQVTVRESPLHKLVLGVGLTTDSGPRASVEYLHNRVPGIGWRAVTKLQLERKSPHIETEWTAIPGEDGWRWGVAARAERLEDQGLVTHAQRLRVGRSRAGDHIDRNVYLQYDRASVQIEPGTTPPLTADTGDGTALSANYVWTGRYFDRLPFASQGFGLGVELGGGVTLSGSKSPFQRTLVRWLGIRPLDQGRLQLRAEAGAVLARGSARVPASQLFRTGGDTTVRGYGYRDIGVDLPGGLVGPGRYMAVGSAEWQRPLKLRGVESNLESVLFIDGGAVSDTLGGLRPVWGVGTGVRWKSPIGPFQADLAYGVKPRRLRVHVTIGMTF